MPEPTLTTEEGQLLELLLYMTGREDRISRKPLVQSEHISGIQAIWPKLKQAAPRAMEPEMRCELMNRLLLGLGISPISSQFFNTVFNGTDFSDSVDFKKRIELFRSLCMLEYGSFRYGYKQFRQGTAIAEKWQKYFPTTDEVTQRARALRTRLETVGLIPIPPGELFSLGYLASEHAPRINDARKRLLSLIAKARENKITDFMGLRAAAKELRIDNLTDVLAKAGIPGAEALFYTDKPLFAGGKKTYPEILLEIEKSCVTVDENAIRQAQANGLHNPSREEEESGDRNEELRGPVYSPSSLWVQDNDH